MKTINSKTLPDPPRVIPTLVAGFDVVTNHIWLLLFPFGLDLLLWLGPHFRLKNLIESWMSMMLQSFQSIQEITDMSEMVEVTQTGWTFVAERFNILMTVRSYPVGIPSLMLSRWPIEVPLGDRLIVDVSSIGSAFLLFGAFALVGILGGTLYFSLVARAALFDQVRWRKVLSLWPRAGLHVILLTFLWFLLLLGILVPISCGASFLLLMGISASSIAALLFGSLFIWLAFPLLFSPHGIFVYQNPVWTSVRKSIRVVRMTLPATALFFIAILILGQGLDLLWQIPSEDSWLMLISLMGHAFTSTGFLSASFIYYQKADVWVESMLEEVLQKESTSDTTA
jgi:hypothetical protein